MPAKAKPGAANARQPYKVFVSSTYRDNKERRRLVQEAITMAGMVWHGMEIFPAGTHPTVEECLRFVKEADVLVGIIAWRYGWEPDDRDKSISEIEYDAAKERLMFLIDPSQPVGDSLLRLARRPPRRPSRLSPGQVCYPWPLIPWTLGKRKISTARSGGQCC